MIKMHLQTILFVCFISFVYGQDRKITSTLNPGCSSGCNSTTLVYVKAEGSQDTIHQIWDFTRGMPTIIYAIGGQNSTLNVTWQLWKQMMPISFEFSEKPVYSFAAAIDKLYEYDDLPDNGHISNKCPRKAVPLSDVIWTRVSSVLNDSNESMLHMHGKYAARWKKGVINVKLDLVPFKDYAVDLPHLIHTANSTLVDVSLVNFTLTPEYNASRFAIHFVLASTDSPNDTMNSTMRKSLDDEHTPGVFEIIEIKTPKSSQSDDGGFMQFRPVGYTEAERSVSSSTNAYISTLNKTDLSKDSTLRVFYKSFDELLVEEMSISIGLPGDGYYKQHNYTSWSFAIGYGVPPVESFSLFVIIIICIGLGVPVVLALSGITYVLVKKYKQRRNPPEPFTDEE